MMKFSGRVSTLLIAIIAPASVVSYSNMTSQDGAAGMYRAEKIDGCMDFHCMKCSTRSRCSLAMKCQIKGCGHKHGAVFCGDGVLFYLRSSNNHTNSHGEKDCESRATTIAQRLNSAMRMMTGHSECSFVVRDEQGRPLTGDENPAIWMEMPNGHNMKIVTITASDVQGYKSRAKMLSFSKMGKPPEQINKVIVARWWADNLEDHFSMMALNQAPSLTTNTHCGRVLLKVWHEVRRETPTGSIPMMAFKAAMQRLSQQEKEHLRLVGLIIPKNYEPIRR